ncbi:chemotaxis protein CheX [Neptuniibacter halophilus]|uniref:chemotaxis protein CheX n=1 Tax=Neptuniibacter halophilus TaxID=651666 RepID=UPI0025736A64|nr:chemotaxis protein CheX [Neptuniibacter halophilus]
MSQQLTPTQLDTLTELFNIGVGKAASVLSEMVNEEVDLCVPKISCSKFDEAAASLQRFTAEKVEAVEQVFTGRFSGVSFLVFSERSSFELVQRLLGSNIPLDELTEMEQDALKEVANIILNACFGSISDMLGSTLESGIPKMVTGTCEQVLDLARVSSEDDPVALIMQVTFSLPAGQVNGSITYVMTADSARMLAAELDNFYNQMV